MRASYRADPTDGGTDAGDSGDSEDPFATGGCTELTTAEFSSVPDHTYSWRRIVAASDRFFITLVEGVDRDVVECVFLAYDRDGSLVTRTDLPADSGLCGAGLISEDGAVLQISEQQLWIGRLDGSGESISRTSGIFVRE